MISRLVTTGIAGLVCAAIILSVAASTQAATLSGRFVYDGKAPTPSKLNITKDVEVCSKHNPVDESLVIGDDGGLANVVVWVRTKGLKAPKGKQDPAVLDNKGCRFEPHVTVVLASEDLIVKNSDPVGHNSNFATFSNPAANFLIPAGGEVKHKFRLDERAPVKVTCNIHPWMVAYVVIRKDPFAAVTGEDGKFSLEGLPAGKELEFVFWQETAGYLDKVTVDGKSEKWSRGRLKMKLKDGENDLGTIKVDPKEFK